MLDRLGVLDEALRSGIDPHGPNAGVGIERIGVWAERFADVVLEEAMDEDHVGPASSSRPDIFCRMNSR